MTTMQERGRTTPPAADCSVSSDPTWSGRPRWSCTCGGTLVHQPYMTEMVWQEATTLFFAQHGVPPDGGAHCCDGVADSQRT